MELDPEVDELAKRLSDLEDRLLSDKLIAEALYKALLALQKIFGKNSRYNEVVLTYLKTEHNVERLDLAAEKSFSKVKHIITPINATASKPRIEVNLNSFLSDFLKHESRLSRNKLKYFHDFFGRTGIYSACKEKGPQQVKKVLKEYVEILESEEDFLKKNIQKLLFDAKYFESLHNILVHEFVHWVSRDFGFERIQFQDLARALTESYAFSYQIMGHLYDPSYVFSRQNVLKEIKELYKIIIPRKEAYFCPGHYKLEYPFMKPFIILMSILVMCDAIARKEGNNRNKALLQQSFECHSVLCIYQIVEQAIENINDAELKELIKVSLLKTAISQLKKRKEDVLAKLAEPFETMNKIKQDILGELDRSKEHYRFRSYFDEVNNKIKHGLYRIVPCLDLLRIMGYDALAKEKKEEFLKILNEIVDKAWEKIEAQYKDLIKSDSQRANELIAKIAEENDELNGICKSLNF